MGLLVCVTFGTFVNEAGLLVTLYRVYFVLLYRVYFVLLYRGTSLYRKNLVILCSG